VADLITTEGFVDPLTINYQMNTNTISNTEGSVNPFTRGLRGHWRPKKSYSYMADRSTSISVDDANLNNHIYRTDIRKDGTIKSYDLASPSNPTSFLEYWTKPDPGDPIWQPAQNAADRWQWVTEVTRTDRFGREVENVDPLDRNSSVLFGYAGSLPTAVASNAQYSRKNKEIW